MRVVAASVMMFALAGCPTVDTGTTPSDIDTCYPKGGLPYFQAEIWPDYLHQADPSMDCARSSCHGGGGTSTMHFETMPVDDNANFQVAVSEVNCNDPLQSRLWLAPSGQISHTGGTLYTTGGPEYDIFLGWFQ